MKDDTHGSCLSCKDRAEAQPGLKVCGPCGTDYFRGRVTLSEEQEAALLPKNQSPRPITCSSG